MNPETLDSYKEFRKELADFLDKNIKPKSLQWEIGRIVDLEAVISMSRYFGLSFSIKSGGKGKDLWHEVILAEELAKTRSLGFALTILSTTNMAIPMIYELGTEQQKKEILVPALKGEKILALGVTEEGSGSDINSIKTTYGDGTLIGNKKYITNGSIADHILVLSKTNDKKGVWRLGFIIVDKGTRGFTSKRLITSGLKSGDTAELNFESCQIPQKNILGKEGKGFYQLLKCIQRERLIGAAALNSLSDHVLQETVSYLKEKKRFGETLSKKQVIRHKISELYSKLEAARQLTYNTINNYILNKPVDKEIIMVKIVAYESAVEIIDYCSHMYGAEAFTQDHWISHIKADSQAFTLAAGSSEVMRELLSGFLKI